MYMNNIIVRHAIVFFFFFVIKEIALNEIRVYNIRGYKTPRISASNWLTTKARGKI